MNYHGDDDDDLTYNQYKMKYHKNMKKLNRSQGKGYCYWICTIAIIVTVFFTGCLLLLVAKPFLFKKNTEPLKVAVVAKQPDVFTFPISVNPSFIDSNADACNNFYGRVCGGWKNNYNRIFKNAYAHNKQSMEDIHHNIRELPTHDVPGHNPRLNKFYRSCRHFIHNGGYDKLLKNKDGLIGEMLSIIDGIETNEDYDKVFGILASKGIRVPIDVSLREFPYFLKKHKNRRKLVFQFEESGVVLSLVNDEWNKDYSSNIRKLKQYIGTTKGLDIHDALYAGFSDTPKNITDDSQYSNNDFTFDHLRNLFVVSPFDMKRFLHHSNLGISEKDMMAVIEQAQGIYVLSMNFFVHLDWIIHKYSVEQWKDYLKLMVYTSVLRKLPPRIPKGLNEKVVGDMVCLDQVKHYFPISVCKEFVQGITDHKHIYEDSKKITEGILKTITDNVKNEPSVYCLKQGSQMQKRLIKSLENIEINIGKCYLTDWEQKISHASTQNYESLMKVETSDRDFVEDDHLANVYKLIGDPMFRLHRAQFMEDYENPFELPRQRRLFDSFIDVNAWYDTVNHRIVIPPGILVPPMIDHRYDAISKAATFGFIIGHEITHSTERLLHRGMGYIKHSSEELKCLNEQLNCLATQYPSPIDDSLLGRGANWYGKQTFYENRADAIGLRSIHHLMKNRLGILNSRKKEEQFFNTVGQTWCANHNKGDKRFRQRVLSDPHAIYRDRVTRPMHQLDTTTRGTFESIYKCKFNYKNRQCFN